MRNSTFNPEWGVGRTLMPSLGVTFLQNSSVSAATDDRRQEDAEGSEGEGAGKRWSLM